MYKYFTTKQHFRAICGSLRNQQLQSLCASFKNRKCTLTDKSFSLLGTRQNTKNQTHRLYSNITHQLDKRESGNQFVKSERENVTGLNNSGEDDAIQKLNDIKQELHTEGDDIMKKLSTVENMEEVT